VAQRGRVGRLVSADLRHRPGRAWALGAGLLVAVVSFVLLTAAVGTSQARVWGTVQLNFRSAYDLLVRPASAATAQEQRRDLVPEDFGSGQFGGITLAQYHRIAGLAGIGVAAPVANLGYVLPQVQVVVPVSGYLDSARVQLFRVHSQYVGQGGLSSYPGEDDYVYYTRANRFSTDAAGGHFAEHTALGPAAVCGNPRSTPPAAGPFDPKSRGGLACFSARSPDVSSVRQGDPPATVGAYLVRQYPLLLSAIDPAQEAKLLGLDQAVVSGRYLNEADAARPAPIAIQGASAISTVPVIANSTTYLQDTVRIQVQRLPVADPLALPHTLASARQSGYLAKLPGTVLAQQDRTAALDYAGVLDRYSHPPTSGSIGDFTEYRQAGPVRYRQAGGVRSALTVNNPDSIWRTSFGSYSLVPAAEADTGFRPLQAVQGTNVQHVRDRWPTPTVRIVGRFDAARLAGGALLSRVPLATYFPPQATGADARSRAALGGKALRPDANIAGYLAQPPALLTTLGAAQAFWNRGTYPNATKAPISYLRIRVAGVRGPDKVSLARIDAAAAAIHRATGLTVDITAGSSPAPQTIALPAGKFGRPALQITERWVAKGVAVQFMRAIDRKSLLLFVLVLVVCMFFLGNAAAAAERARRTDLAVLSCLGWSRRSLFSYVLGQQATTGVLAGLAGTGLAAVLVAVLHLRLDPWRLVLIAPTAVLIACVAGLLAAVRAARTEPLDAIAAPVARLGRGRRVHTLFGLALANVGRLPGRSVAGGAALFVAVAALTIVVAVTQAFRSSLVGNLLGAAVSLQVRDVDYLAVGLMLVLADLSLADIVYLNHAERSDEVATLSAMGWTPGKLRALFAMEGLIVAVTGSVLGAAAGLGFVAALVSVSAAAVLAAVAAVGLGVVTATIVILVPVSQISRRPPAVQFSNVE
jgi:putative ABC transport system permease protein